MGMYDNVRVERDELPGMAESPRLYLFQTKDFDNVLGVYTISQDGRLLDGERKDTNFHGLFQFYGRVGEAFKCWEAKFTDGKLVGYRILGD